MRTGASPPTLRVYAWSAAALARGCAEAWKVGISAGAPSAAEIRLAQELAADRYLCADWNAGRLTRRTLRGSVKVPG